MGLGRQLDGEDYFIVVNGYKSKEVIHRIAYE